MLSHASAVTATPSGHLETYGAIDPLGACRVLLDHKISFPRGLPGLAQQQEFALTWVSGRGEAAFFLVGTATEPLALQVMPVDLADGPYATQDLEAALRVSGIDRERALLFVIVRRSSTPAQTMVNLRAPIVIDTAGLIGFQVILAADHYPFRCPIGDLPKGRRDRPAAR
jgi:flagellar assembly factor FliW